MATGIGGAGIEFTETMRGFLSSPAGEDTGRDAPARRDDSPLEFTVTVAIDDLDRMLADPEHSGRIVGSVTAPALSGRPLEVRGGRFSLFARDPERARARRMTYRMPLMAVDGRRFLLEGIKTIHDDPGPDLWSDTTTLRFTLYEDGKDRGAVLGRGSLRISLADFRRQLGTVRVTNAQTRGEELWVLARFGHFFAGMLNETYGGAFGREPSPDRDVPPRGRRALRLPIARVYPFDTSDGIRLRLTRFQGGERGPVILAPGITNSALFFTVDTVETNLAEYLVARGYDVWILDYRASCDLPSGSSQFTLDEIALQDWPAAVEQVRETSGADSVQVVAHCVASLTFLMSMASGRLAGVRSAVASQFTLHPVVGRVNRIRMGMYLPTLLAVFGVDLLQPGPEHHARWKDRVYETALRLYPPGAERCNRAVCRRLLFMWGEVYAHEQLNAATHDAIPEMFGASNVTAYRHLGTMVRKGRAVTAEGEDLYLRNLDRLRIPIAFLQGGSNRLLLPAGSERTLRALCEANGAERYARHLFPAYAHMDCFIGKNAARDIYPVVVSELEKHNTS